MSTSSPHTRDLFTALVDDAAMFPPGNASAADALSLHLQHRRGPHAAFVGPLLVHESRWEEFLDAYVAQGSPRLEVAIIGSTCAMPALPDSLRVVGFESVATDGVVPEVASARHLALEVPDLTVSTDVLKAIGEERAAGKPWVAKFRTGGTSADAFPDEVELAEVIRAAFDAGVPFKLTAGLHHAVRHTDPDTGFEHHGFLNVMVAVHHCTVGEDRATLSAVLAERSALVLVTEIQKLSAHEINGLRSVFTSFGCCGVEEPLADAVMLGLIEAAPQ